MAIRASLSKEITALVGDLASDRSMVRDAAVARLTVIGARAAVVVAGVAGDRKAPPAARLAALRVLEATAAPAGCEIALAQLDDPAEDIVRAAIAALRPHVHGAGGASVVDRLTAIAMDSARGVAARETALRVLLELDQRSLRPLLKALRDDPSPEIAALAAKRPAGQPPPEEPAELLAGAVEGRLPADGEMVRRALAHAGGTLSLTDILTLIERIREHEKTQPLAARGPWQALRASAHLVLARRGSRIALYDLRETVERAKEPIALEFLAALNALGDASCVEALAKAYASTGDRWWRGHLVQTFRTIVGRARLTRRHAAIRRLKERDPRVFAELWPGGA